MDIQTSTNDTSKVTSDVINSIIVDAATGQLTGKKWYLSKTLWANVLALGAVVLQMKFGFIISPEVQMLGLACVNTLLRNITKEEIVWF